MTTLEQKPKTLKRRRKTKIDIQLQSKRNKNETEQEVKLFHKCMFCEFTCKSLQRFKVHIKRHQNVLPIAAIVPKVSSKKYGEWLQCPKEICEFETTQNDILDEHLKSKILYFLVYFNLYVYMYLYGNAGLQFSLDLPSP